MTISATGGAFASGVLGIQRGGQGITRAAGEIASATASTDAAGGAVQETTRPLLEARLHLRDAQAAALVVQAADEVRGSLLDVFA